MRLYMYLFLYPSLSLAFFFRFFHFFSFLSLLPIQQVPGHASQILHVRGDDVEITAASIARRTPASRARDSSLLQFSSTFKCHIPNLEINLVKFCPFVERQLLIRVISRTLYTSIFIRRVAVFAHTYASLTHNFAVTQIYGYFIAYGKS